MEVIVIRVQKPALLANRVHAGRGVAGAKLRVPDLGRTIARGSQRVGLQPEALDDVLVAVTREDQQQYGRREHDPGCRHPTPAKRGERERDDERPHHVRIPKDLYAADPEVHVTQHQRRHCDPHGDDCQRQQHIADYAAPGAAPPEERLNAHHDRFDVRAADAEHPGRTEASRQRNGRHERIRVVMELRRAR